MKLAFIPYWSAVCLLAAVVVSAGVIVPPRDVTYSSLNTDVLRPRAMPYDPRNVTNATWVMTSSCCDYGPFTSTAVQAASEYYGLFDVPCGWPDMPAVGEWVRA